MTDAITCDDCRLKGRLTQRPAGTRNDDGTFVATFPHFTLQHTQPNRAMRRRGRQWPGARQRGVMGRTRRI